MGGLDFWGGESERGGGGGGRGREKVAWVEALSGGGGGREGDSTFLESQPGIPDVLSSCRDQTCDCIVTPYLCMTTTLSPVSTDTC